MARTAFPTFLTRRNLARPFALVGGPGIDPNSRRSRPLKTTAGPCFRGVCNRTDEKIW
jgi:hypothetical protein